ncbi:hypothetical protein [Micromonospora sp. U21]|uniref:hypothetical protein n=1 Tax=Micromonospora sp. U21 TaxID=2824899 RepID=UPI001B3681C2|nr:hypothetical protein [Micromonospora sp. U21]MBQ0902365.1 hypothetical protein [Micromonospora sp. U21]
MFRGFHPDRVMTPGRLVLDADIPAELGRITADRLRAFGRPLPVAPDLPVL